MDELEISGKRYLSAKRAAKEHKYHADYIGQLVRTGKVVGQKVGRAWYVEERSLAEYFGKEIPEAPAAVSAPAPTPIARVIDTPVAAPTPVQVLPAAGNVRSEQEIASEVRAEVIAEKIVEEEIKAEQEISPAPAPIAPASTPAASVAVPTAPKLSRPIGQTVQVNVLPKAAQVRLTRSLTYIEDEAPVLPPVGAVKRAPAPEYASVSVRRLEEATESEEAEMEREPIVKKHSKKSKIKLLGGLAIIGGVVLAIVAAASTFVASSVVVQDGKPASAAFTIK